MSTSENPYTRKPPETFEEHTQSEKGSDCPLKGGPCLKDPQLCRLWQPFLINKIHPILQTVTQEDVYMCWFDSMRASLNNILLIISGQMMINRVGGAGPGDQPPG